MTKKDYILLARVLKQARQALEGRLMADETIAVIAYDLCYALKQDNPRFDKERFLEAALG